MTVTQHEPLDPRLLSMFVEMAESGNMQLVAKSLSITPSAISHGIKRLEESLGCKLFDRQGRKLLLNDRGYLFLPEAKALLQQMQSAIQRFHNQADWRQGRLRIGSNSIGCEQILPMVIREYRDSFPEVTISIQEGDAAQLVDALQARQLGLCAHTVQSRLQGFDSNTLAKSFWYFCSIRCTHGLSEAK
ncbi:MAG: LysR family transcriptional regulator [Verrucomicrobia bacterium]|nr:LysR family transcriptional regulator [Verrucomicrobiota bacterium]